MLRCAAVGLIGIWLAYGLFTAFPNIIFMMMCCVVIASAVFFLAEWLSLVSAGLYWCQISACVQHELCTMYVVAAAAAAAKRTSIRFYGLSEDGVDLQQCRFAAALLP
jgi:hypothetical protein